MLQFAVTFDRDDTYGYDDAGQLRSVTDNLNPTATLLVEWDYDTLGRRTQTTVTAEGAGRVPGPAGTVGYVYDPVGNLATIDHPSGPDTNLVYDDAGRRTSTTTGDVVVDYGWDPAGDLVARTETDDTTTVFDEARSYDPAGHLTQITTTTGTDTTTDKMWWDPTWGVPALSGWEHTPDGEPTVTYKFGAGPDGRPRIDDQAGNMWVLDVRGSHIDHYGTTQDHTIAYADHYTWWGEATDPDNGGDHTGTQPGLGYRGEIHTHDLIHLRHRDYDPTIGTFLTPDPLDGVDGTTTVTNPWHYTDNNPLNKVDPLGLAPSDPDFDFQLELLDQEVNLQGFDAARYFQPYHDAVARWIRDKAPGQRRLDWACAILGAGAGATATKPTWGRPDVCDTATDELWEVKPASDYGFRTGSRQLQRYIDTVEDSGGVARRGEGYPPHLHLEPGMPGPTISFSGSRITGDQGVRYYSPLELPVPGRVTRKYEARVSEQDLRILEAELQAFVEGELEHLGSGGWNPTPTQIGIGVGVIVVGGLCIAATAGVCAGAAAGGLVVAGGA